MNAASTLRSRRRPYTLGKRENLLAPDQDGPFAIVPQDAPIDLERLLPRIVETVQEGGAIARRMFREGGAERWTKGDDSPVTAADIAVDRFLGERLPALVEGSGWLSEETADTTERLGLRRIWVVDPIDGTRAFIEGRPEWVVCAALVQDGAAVAGVVYDPCHDVTYSARLGGGAWRDGVRLSPPDSPVLEGVRAGSSAGMVTPLKSHGVVRGPWFYALANRLVKVAAGELDAALARASAADWDIAAAQIIIEEAGARLTGIDGATPRYNRPSTRHGALVAAPPARHRALLAAFEAERDVLANMEPYR